MPGPGAYYPSDVHSSTGGYVVSNFKNHGTHKFVQPRLKDAFRSQTPMNRTVATPGPGSYLLPSDFGYLDPPKGSPRGST